MQHKPFLRTLALGVATAAALTLAAAAADTAGSGVTFVNGGNHPIDLYTRYGSDSACDAKPEAKKLTVDAGQTAKLDSGSSTVCFCLKLPDRGNCPSGGWGEVKPGGTRHLM
ncbi:MAG: hypothetical protein DMF53_08120 [Acidobacteria bacterium]|nr:MAG: hypothetical protein DMF53_08120 [Acidobacteriota bacterium]